MLFSILRDYKLPIYHHVYSLLLFGAFLGFLDADASHKSVVSVGDCKKYNNKEEA